MANGVLYILTNPSFPEYVKIGYADDMHKRLKELNRSECIPFAFRVFATYEVKERLQDMAVHKMIDNINPDLRAIETFDGKQRKKEFYAMSAEDAYAIFETIAKISGTTDRLKKFNPEGHEISDEKLAEEVETQNVYTEEMLLCNASDEIKKLYQKYKNAMLDLGGVTVEAKKLYIAFNNSKKFVDIELHNHNLKIYLNMHFGSLTDKKGIAQDVSQIGHWGNGDYRITATDDSDFDDIMELIKQSYFTNKNKDQ